MIKTGFYVDRYLCKQDKKQNLDTFSFLMGEMTYESHNLIYTMDIYQKFEDIRHNPFNFIIGNGGLGKSTYLKQIKQNLENERIPCLLIELRALSDESSLYNRINNFYKTNYNTLAYILLDAVDEAIDCNIKNIAYKISDAISKIICKYKVKRQFKVLNRDKFKKLKESFKTSKRQKIKNICKTIYPDTIKTIITCRDNRIPQELVPNLQKIYKTKENYTFNLCRLTEEDAKNIAMNFDCKNSDDFISKIKEYNLGSFASSPITLISLVEMYKKDELNQNSNNFDIYETLMRYWCDETEYRKNKALNNEDSFKLQPTDEILFVASKIAIELKLSCKNGLSYTGDDSSIKIENFYNLSFDLPNGKKIIFSKELVDYTLKTKIFCKVNNKFFIEQQTYKDFLSSRYLYIMQSNENDIFKLVKINNDFHPNFTESLAYLSLINNKIFNTVIKAIPERILLSSVYFSNEKQKEILFNTYLNCIKNDIINFWNYNPGRVFFHKKLYFTGLNKILKQKLKTSDSDIKDTIIDLIWDNRLTDFETEFRNIIFDKKTEQRIKVTTIYACKDCQYTNILTNIAENLDEFDEQINKYTNDQLRGILLCCLYPGFIDTQTMLGYIKEPEQEYFFGHYRQFINHQISKNVSIDNAGLLLDWIRENNNMTSIVRSFHGSDYTDTIKEIFNKVSEILNFDLITKYVSLQLAEKYAFQITSDDIINKILENTNFRKFYINQLIKRSNSIQNFKTHIWHLQPNPITTYEIPEYLNMYIDEEDNFTKEKIAIAINNTFIDYLNNSLVNDIDEIYNILESNNELKQKFGYFILPTQMDSLTLEPIDKAARLGKKYYYLSIKNKEKEELRKQKIQELNNINKRIEDSLSQYKVHNNLEKTILLIFQILFTEKDSQYYLKQTTLVLQEIPRWQEVFEGLKNKLINIFKIFLINEVDDNLVNIENLIDKNSYLLIWNCLSTLPLLKVIDMELYNKILKNWSSVIIYFNSDSVTALNIKQNLLLDLCNLDSSLILTNISKIILKSTHSLPYNFLKSLKFFWNEEFDKWIFDFVKTNEAKLDDSIIFEILQVIASHKYKPVEIYIKNKVDNIIKSKNIDENKIAQLLNILIYKYKEDSWNYAKKLIYKNRLSKEILVCILKESSYPGVYSQSSLYKFLPGKELSKLYKWLINKYPYINEYDYKLGVSHNTDFLKEFTTHIPDYFITEGNVIEYKKTKKAYFKNRNNIQNYKKYYYRGLLNAKYNRLQNTNIEYNRLKILENKYFKEKKGLVDMKIGKYIFGDNNTNYINENSNNKSINFGKGILITIFILVIGFVLLYFGKIDFSQFLQILGNK